MNKLSLKVLLGLCRIFCLGTVFTSLLGWREKLNAESLTSRVKRCIDKSAILMIFFVNRTRCKKKKIGRTCRIFLVAEWRLAFNLARKI